MAKSSKYLGPYELLGVVGSGGMGVVYRARDTRLGRQVAIKVLLPDVASNDNAIARFEREARAVAALSHSNILTIHDFGRDDGSVYAVMEFLDGQTLREMVESGPLPVRKAVTIGVQIANGLAAAHGRDIVHRDLKPENIGVTRAGQVKILDFGLAREVFQPPPDSRTATYLSTPGMVVGTVGYMSPEQVRGCEVDYRSDLFSFGVVFHEMLTSRRAFARDTAAETLTAILNEEPQDLADSGVKVPPALDHVIHRCLEKHPQDRFHSADDLAFALENAMSSQTSIEPVRQWGRPRRLLLPTLLVGGGLVAGALLSTLSQTAPATEPLRVRQLTLSGLDSDPSASPDGVYVAFASSRSGTSRIYLRHLVTGGEQDRTPGHRPRFFRDGSILFLNSDGGSEAAWRIPPVGGAPQRLVSDVVEADPSPDGRRLAFVRFATDKDGARTASLGVAQTDGNTERSLLSVTNAEFSSVRWSPGGDRLALIRRATIGPSLTAIVIVDVNSGQVLRELQGGPEAGAYGALAWSDDGRGLVVTRSNSDQVYVPGEPGRVLQIDASGGRRRTLFYAPNLFGLFGTADANAGIDVLGPGRVVFESVEIRQNLVEVSRDGNAASAHRIETLGNGLDRQPAYSPDGRFVVFTSNRSGNFDLWVQSTGTREIWQLTNDRAQDWDRLHTRRQTRALELKPERQPRDLDGHIGPHDAHWRAPRVPRWRRRREPDDGPGL